MGGQQQQQMQQQQYQQLLMSRFQQQQPQPQNGSRANVGATATNGGINSSDFNEVANYFWNSSSAAGSVAVTPTGLNLPSPTGMVAGIIASPRGNNNDANGRTTFNFNNIPVGQHRPNPALAGVAQGAAPIAINPGNIYSQQSAMAALQSVGFISAAPINLPLNPATHPNNNTVRGMPTNNAQTGRIDL